MLIKDNIVESEYYNFHSFFSNENIGIPIFQRFFAWKPAQTEELLKDISDAIVHKNQNIYLLDIIYYSEDGKIKLADGQQRLVSMNIFRKAINDFIFENNLSINPVKLYSISYDIDVHNQKYIKSFSTMPVAPFKKIYLHFRKYIQNNADKIVDIIEVLNERIFVYAKKCANADDAFLIFQQINTGGKPLTKDEIIKTSIDQYSEIYGIKIEGTVKELKQMIISYYKYKLDDTNSNFDNIAIMSFLKNYVVKSKESFQEFKNALSIVSISEDFPICHVIKFINRSQLFDIINVLSMKGINVNKNKDYVTKLMAPLCLLSVCMTIKKSNPGGIIKSMYSEIIKMIKEDENIDDISFYLASFINNNPDLCKITFESFKNALGDVTLSQGVKKGLLVLDLILKHTSSTIENSCINLEHIYPQKPDFDWARNGWPTDREEQMMYISNIGNFLILNEEINKSIKNKYIDLKVFYYDKINAVDNSLQTQINSVDFKRFETERTAYIKYRQESIAFLIRSTFPFGANLITD